MLYSFQDNEFDFEGFISLFEHCPNHEHLNIAGEHHHINADPDRAEEMRNALERIKGRYRVYKRWRYSSLSRTIDFALSRFVYL